MGFMDYKVFCCASFHDPTMAQSSASQWGAQGAHCPRAGGADRSLTVLWRGWENTHSAPGMRPVLSRTLCHLEPPLEQSSENVQEGALSSSTKVSSPSPFSSPQPQELLSQTTRKHHSASVQNAGGEDTEEQVQWPQS